MFWTLTLAVEHRDVVGSQFGFCLYAHQQRGSSASSHDLIGEVLALERQSESALLR